MLHKLAKMVCKLLLFNAHQHCLGVPTAMKLLMYQRRKLFQQEEINPRKPLVTISQLSQLFSNLNEKAHKIRNIWQNHGQSTKQLAISMNWLILMQWKALNANITQSKVLTQNWRST